MLRPDAPAAGSERRISPACLQDEERFGARLPGLCRRRRRPRHPLCRPALRRQPVPRACPGSGVDRGAGLHRVRPDRPAVGAAARGSRVVAGRRGHPHRQHLDPCGRGRPPARPGLDARRRVHLRILGPTRLRRHRVGPIRSRRGHPQPQRGAPTPPPATTGPPTTSTPPSAPSGPGPSFPSCVRDLVTVLPTTHDRAEAERLADWIAVPVGGRIRSCGPPAAWDGQAAARAEVRWTADDGTSRRERTEDPSWLVR